MTLELATISPAIKPNLRNARTIEFARQRMDEYIQRGQSRAVSAVERILGEIPNDRVTPTRALLFSRSGPGFFAHSNSELLGMLGDHAFRQVSSVLGLPVSFANEVAARGEWGADLVAGNLSSLAQHVDDQNGRAPRLLFRTIGDEVRGVVSDSYRRLDARPVVDSLVKIAKDSGAIISDGFSGPTRVAMKMIVPRIFEPIPGEFMVYGLDYATSDYGDGTQQLRSFLFRLVCWNGAVGEQALRQIHLGRRLEHEIAYSERTYRLDTAANASAVRDLATHLLAPSKLEVLDRKVSLAGDTEIEIKKALGEVRSALSKGEHDAVLTAYNTGGVEELPAGNTAWRFSNAISFVARNTEDGRRRLDLEALAGSVLPSERN